MLTDTLWRPIPNPRAIQWWFFLLVCDDGRRVRGRLWSRLDRCGVELNIYGPGEPEDLLEDYGADEFFGEQDRVLVMAGPNRVEERGGAWSVAVRACGRVLELEGRAEEDAPTIRYPVDHTHGFVWTVPALRGAFEGNLDGEPLRGALFIDHVRADIRPTWRFLRHYRGWFWALVSTSRRAALFLDVDMADEPFQVATADDAVLERDPFRVRLDGAWREIEDLAVFHKRHVVVESRLQEAITNALPGFRKEHGFGRVDDGFFWYERMRLR